ncbi:MAG: hypothetical protein Q8O56_05730 [Solirubrobacteraceae bacterium]|nr:hypothetical protein [Solirubrobacteraceae bacterium]
MTDGPTNSYETRLVLALRHRDVSGGRIGEVLAEVQSHLAESGERADDAFGSPEDYADRVAASTSERSSPHLPARFLAAVCLPAAAGGAALAEGVHRLGAGGRTDLGWFAAPPLAMIGAGALLLAAVALLVRPHVDRIVDPRTRQPVLLSPRERVVLVALPVTILALLWLLGRAGA